MVEKIIVNPNEVRGYGNIMNPHKSMDYESYSGRIIATTDTVNGQTVTAYEMKDTIIFWDKGTSTDYSAWASSTTMNITRDGECTTVTPVDSSVFSSRYLTITTDDCTIEFDVKCNNVSEAFFSIRQGGTSKKSFLPSTCGISADTWYHIKITISGTAVTLYNNGVQKDTGTADSHNRFYFSSNQNVNKTIKYKNFKISTPFMFVDAGTSTSYSEWETPTTMSVTRDSTCTTLTPVDSTVFSLRYLTITTDDCTIEFDVNCSNVSEAFFSIRQGSTSKASFSPETCGINADTWYHIRMEIVGTELKLYNEGVLKDTKHPESHNRFYFTSNANVSKNIKYKNFKIY